VGEAPAASEAAAAAPAPTTDPAAGAVGGDSAAAPAPAAEPPSFGNAASGTAVAIVNNTKLDITQLSVKRTGSKDNPESLMGKDQRWAGGSSATVYLPSSENSSLPATEESNGEPLALSGLDIQISFANKTSATLHAVSLADKKGVRINLKGAVAYVTYTDSAAKEVSTLDSEQALQDAADKAAAAKAATAKTAAAPSTPSKSYSYGSSSSSSSSGSSSSGSSSSSSASKTPKVSADDCVSDPLFK
ncbi:MAG: hypothetical protein FWF71_01015, partial [Actinomycetia bacterium]|nr:hypothetical protein [Actinomycetes bacterium]